MEHSNYQNEVRDDVAISRLYDLARNGETASNEFVQLSHVIIDGLQRTYGSEIQHRRSMAA